MVAPFASRYAESPERSYVDDAAYEVELELQARGYARAVTRFEVAADGAARIAVEAGARSTIGDVEVRVVDEDCPIATDDLRRYVQGPRTGLFGSGPMLYVEARVRAAPERVRRDLVALGHLDAEAELVEGGAAPEEGGPVDVVLEVRPGCLYHVVGHTFTLDRTSAPLSDDAERDVDDAIVEALRAPDSTLPVFRPRLAGTLRGAVADALGSNGYPDAEVEVRRTLDADSGTVELEVRANPGPFVTIRSVEVKGERRTTQRFLRSRLAVEDGDTYDAAGLRRSLRRLYRTGLFAQVDARLTGIGDSRSILLEVVERPAVELYAEPGYGSYELGRLTLGANHRNLFGNGIRSSAEITAAVRAQRGRIALTDPWFLRRELTGDLQIEFDRREEPSFVRQSRGVGAFVTKEWTRAHATTYGYRFRRSEATDVEAVDDDVLDLQSSVNVSGLIATHVYDVRDALFAPTRGSFVEISTEIAADGIGSELEFVRGLLTSAFFTPLSEDDVLGFGLRAGVIAPSFDESTIPLQERFFAGGENSVRSFLESRLGPRDTDGSPLGGEAFGTASLEWRHVLGGPFQSALFVDAGFVEPEAGDLLSPSDVRLGVGAGLRYLLPIGPLRVDAAFNPDRSTGEDEWVVHFSIGMPF
ncbi:MAG: BamA/TamA family outer membrane protein [Planctomycetota bacterium]